MDDSSFEILLFAYSYDFGEVHVVDLACGEEIPEQVLEDLTDDGVKKTAYNAPFERTCLAKYLNREMPPSQWDCTLVLAAQMGLPLSLDGVSDVLLTPDKAKLKDGKALIRYFCTPCRPTKSNGGRTRNLPEHDPEKWERFKEYNRQDVVAENEIRKKLLRHLPNETEHRFWELDQKINDRGIKVDLQMSVNAVNIDRENKERIKDIVFRKYGIRNAKSNMQIKQYIENGEGIEIKSLDKDHISEVKAQLTLPDTKRLLSLREAINKTSTAKYEAILRSVCSDEHIRGLFQFYGANRTGRFAGRLLQVQNLARNKMPDLDEARKLLKVGDAELFNAMFDRPEQVLSELIRTTLIPEEGCKFIVADFSAIEARVIAWLAKEEWVLEEFRGEGKIYEATAAQMFGVDKGLIKKGNPEYALRAKGKICQLALGYQGGEGAMVAMGALDMGLTEDELPKLVQMWRKANPKIVKLWYSIQEAAMTAVKRKGFGKCKISGTEFNWERGQLFMTLPSKRKICYMNARIGTNRFGSESILYDGLNQTNKRWETLETYGGKLTENLVQATARDLLRDSMLALDSEGYDIRMHVHDEVIINEPVGGRTVEAVCEIMGRDITWAPGLPLRAEGFETQYYKKD